MKSQLLIGQSQFRCAATQLRTTPGQLPHPIPLIIGLLTGHACVLQDCDCEEEPLQYDPPFAGVGLLQARVRVRVPPPQD